jgi:transposase
MIKEVECKLKQADSVAALKRLQCVLFRAKLNVPVATVADMVGYSVGTVYNILSACQRLGTTALAVSPRGGRNHCHLSREEEAAVLASCMDEVHGGHVLKLGNVRAAYERAVGHAVAPSTVYRMVHAHGWRKIAPRPQHPKGDPQVVAAYKKSSRASSAGRARWRRVAAGRCG